MINAAANARAIDTIISRLRPRDVGGIIDQAFRLYRKHFWTFLAIIAVVHVPTQLLVQAANIAFLGSVNRSYRHLQWWFFEQRWPVQ